MTGNKRSTAPDWHDPDDAPDLSSLEWRKKFASAEVRRGRPKSETTKVSTTIRLDPDVIERFKAQGPGWQSRINDALKDWLTQHAA